MTNRASAPHGEDLVVIRARGNVMTDETRRAQWRESQARRRAGLPRLRAKVAKCGTVPGARRHRRNGEEVCKRCKRAEAEEWQRRNPKT